jgi:tRNA modification GTPase
MHPREQTIFALSSGRPPTAIAIVRVSGPQAGRALEQVAGRIPLARTATRTMLRDADREPIDDAVVLWFPGPASATGEDVAEFHVHGGRAILASLFAALSTLGELRPAEAGEFTRRAFENGKLDLTEAEGLDDLIHSDTDRQRRQALRQLNGLLGDRARHWRAQIIEAAALIEAGIDFSDEGDVPEQLVAPALVRIRQLSDEIADVLGAQGRSERLRDGVVVAIAGPPNVGKSTLMNPLARREVAIVSPHAGTTRDAIEVQLDLKGYPVTVIDTAGIRETEDPVEQEGVRRARTRAAEADLVLWLVDAERGGDMGLPSVGDDTPIWVVRNKIDLDAVGADAPSPNIPAANPKHPAVDPERHGDKARFAISASRGDGLSDLLVALVAFAESYFGSGEEALIGRERQRSLLQQTGDSLRRSIEVVGQGEELAAEELRSAAHSLGRLLGRVDIEDVLDAIFRDFCIGK